MSSYTLRIQSNDDLIVALRDLPKGTQIPDSIPYSLLDAIPAKHKFASRAVSVGDSVTMYGVVVGKATRAIPRGGLVGTHNLEHASESYSWRPQRSAWSPPDLSELKSKTFMGFRREGGKVGTSNHWLVIPLVFCENRNLMFMRDALHRTLGYSKSDVYQRHVERLFQAYSSNKDLASLQSLSLIGDSANEPTPVFPHVDGIQFLTHEGGCGGTREDTEALCALLAGYITHPNVAGATVLSLGCQHAQIPVLEDAIAKRDPSFSKPLHIFEQQKSKSERVLMQDALNETFIGVAKANELRREEVGIDELVIGVECGGSDGFSGVSANPAIGRVSDLLVGGGGKVLLSEFPELCGAEQDLIDRCSSEEVADKFVRLMRTYEKNARDVGSGFDQNPSPGNIREGLITDAIKSLGAAKKGGTSPVVDVLDYHETARVPGLHLLCTPGNDVESTTGLAAAGATIILFSTGLGTPTGNPITPVIKISTSTSLAERMQDIIDFDAGSIISGTSIESVGQALFELAIETANGDYVPKAVRLGQNDFIPWKRGVSL